VQESTLNFNITLPTRNFSKESKEFSGKLVFKLQNKAQELNIILVLNNKILRKPFQEYLSQEFSSENIFLWRALQHWFNAFGVLESLFNGSLETPEQTANRQKSVNSATKVNEQFIPTSAPLMVNNISSRRSNSLHLFLEENISKCVQSTGS
jgi:hypothetical protein